MPDDRDDEWMHEGSDRHERMLRELRLEAMAHGQELARQAVLIETLGTRQDKLEESLREMVEHQKQIATSLAEVARTLEQVPADTHGQHHRILEQILKREENKAEFWKEVASKVATGGIWAAAVGLFWVVVYGAKHFLTTWNIH